MLLTLSILTLALSISTVLQWFALRKLRQDTTDQGRALDRLFRNGLATGAFRFESAEAQAEAERQGYELPAPYTGNGGYL